MPVGACSFQPSLCGELAWPWGDLPFSEPQLPVWLRTQPELGPSSSIHSVEGREKHVNSLQRALQLPTQDRDYALKATHNTSFWGKEEGRKENQSWRWGSPGKNTRCWQQQILGRAGGGHVHPSPHCLRLAVYREHWQTLSSRLRCRAVSGFSGKRTVKIVLNCNY